MTKLDLSALHTCVEHSQAYVKFTSAKDRKAIRDQVAEKAAKSPRVRWAHLLSAIDAGDLARVQARATGDWAAVKPVAKAVDKAPAKAAPKARSSKAAKPAKQDFRAMARELVASLPTEAERVAFFTALADVMPKK
jgi:hypothetical protein